MELFRTIVKSLKAPDFKDVAWLDINDNMYRLKFFRNGKWVDIYRDYHLSPEDYLLKDDANQLYQPKGNYIEDAPIDDKVYGRLNGEWSIIEQGNIEDAPADNILYSRYNNDWNPSIGQYYLDKNKNRLGEIFNNYSDNIASGLFSHAEGNNTKASGQGSHSEGFNTISNGDYSHSGGVGTITYNRGEYAIGRYNTSMKPSLLQSRVENSKLITTGAIKNNIWFPDTLTALPPVLIEQQQLGTLFSVGIGENAESRKNAIEILEDGTIYIVGVGNYEGSNSISSESLQDILNNLDDIITVDSELSDESTNPVENRVITIQLQSLIQDIQNLQKEVFPLSVTVSGGGTFEKGTTQNVTIRWTTKLGSTIITPESITVNDVSVANTSTSKVFSGVTSTTTYTVKVTNNGIMASGSKKATFVAPMYFGFAAASSVDSLTIESLTKQTIKENPVGTYTINNPTKGYYLWLCVPDSMTINKVVSSGFDVPMEAPATASTTIDTYKCYRTSAAPNPGDMTITIS